MDYYTTPLFDLMQAVRKDDAEGVRAALAAGADINGDGDHCPLVSSTNGHTIAMTVLLLDLGADINATNHHGENAMDLCCDHLAIGLDQELFLDMIVLLKERGIDWEASRHNSHSYTLARYAPASYIQKFMDMGMMDHVCREKGLTVLQGLAMSDVSCDNEVYDQLVQYSLKTQDISDMGFLGLTAWEAAIGDGNTRVAQLFECHAKDRFLGIEELSEPVFAMHEDAIYDYEDLHAQIKNAPLEELYVWDATLLHRINHPEVTGNIKEIFGDIYKVVAQRIEWHTLNNQTLVQQQNSKSFSKKM